jgi:hypothetical protein
MAYVYMLNDKYIFINEDISGSGKYLCTVMKSIDPP